MPKLGGMETKHETEPRSAPVTEARELLKEQRSSGLSTKKFARSRGASPGPDTTRKRVNVAVQRAAA